MSATYPSPTPDEVAELLHGLLGREVSVKPKPGIALGPRDPGTVAIYSNEEDQVVGVVLCDLPLAISTGAALSMIPSDIATENIRKQELTGDILENVREVFNIVAQVFNRQGRPRVHFKAAHVTPPPPDREVVLLVARPKARIDLAVDVQEYGGGKMTVVSS
ncbi:MAG: hypothetical protein AB1486_25130 [Planctomycetota bacterium]